MTRRPQGGRPPSPLARSLRRPGFRRLLAAHTVSRWGDTFNFVAIVVLVFDLTGSGLKVGATVMFEIAPILLFGFVAGVVADRSSRRLVMIAADLGRAVLALGLVFAQDSLWTIYGLAFCLSALSAFFNPAASSAVPDLVDDDELVGANSALWSAAVISQIVLAPVAGGVVAWAGPGAAFTVNAASFVVSAVLIARLPLPHRSGVRSSPRRRDLIEGFRVISRSRLLRILALVQALAALSAGATSALLVVLAQRRLGAGPGRFGLLLSAIGVGAAVGPLALQRLAGDVRRPLFLFGPYGVRAVVDLVLAATTRFGVAAAALAAYGVGTSTGTVTYNTVLHSTVDERFRGRVFSFFDVVWQVARLASIAAGGVLADAVGIRAVYVLGGALLATATVIGLVGLRREHFAAVTPDP